jgi:uncharacterized LabA/DUF88 family protein
LEKVAILIDGMYVENAARVFGFEKVDVEKLPSILLKPSREELFRIYVFDALPYLPIDATPRQIHNHERKRSYLEGIRYIDRVFVDLGDVRPKYGTCHECNKKTMVPVQKLVDVKISVRLVALGWGKTVDTIVLFSGDKDILPAVEEVNRSGTGVNVRLAYVEDSGIGANKELIKSCPETMRITREQLLSCKKE